MRRSSRVASGRSPTATWQRKPACARACQSRRCSFAHRPAISATCWDEADQMSASLAGDRMGSSSNIVGPFKTEVTLGTFQSSF
ncbi:hypothetical protein AK812_SmicGene22512 [Symbiodinium microadriaticum]|uniref:Uncharacterized protein n=1 Tax=Symbiodinium microadriaticum TaxID=2951 RepID=A0A1Q9DJK4_SYMMI|nr:hypothetical protein AK812_SmicGene22512 [Symbiodinium microadriaticum]